MSGVMICPDCLCKQHSESWEDNQMVVGVPGMPNQFVSLPVSHPVISCNECPTKWTDWRHEDVSEAIQNAFNRGYAYGKGREVEKSSFASRVEEYIEEIARNDIVSQSHITLRRLRKDFPNERVAEAIQARIEERGLT